MFRHGSRWLVGRAKAMSPGVRRESQWIRSAANTACLSADRL
ncbi:MAG: hypothetical protein U9P07_13010 [Pseudomonadota bacterium]|nr:hypothetical protein [Pseudomonadota bacterium]